ncbi:MAG: hypothetical protein AAF944_25405 [Bacteroidota bacterium]
MNKMNFRTALVLSLSTVILLTSCDEDDSLTVEIVNYQSTLAQLDPLDKGGRWLANGIKETNELNSLAETQEATITNFLNDLAINTETRCNESANDAFMNDLIAEGYPQEAITIVENAIIRVCSELNVHEGYWVENIVDPNIPFPITAINDMHIDAATRRVTIYVQTKVNGQVITPPQVEPGECTTSFNGDTVCFHPNAVYLNGSGEELMQGDGTGEWWVKRTWELDGEGFLVWEAESMKDYGEGLWVEAMMLEDGVTMKVGDLANAHNGEYNLRKPHLNNSPVTYTVTRYDANDQFQYVNTFSGCTTENSAFDGLARSCPN